MENSISKDALIRLGAFALTLTACCIHQFAIPAEAASGTEAASFLDIPVGGRPAALAGAYAALANDAYAVTTNPGGLGFVDSTQIAAQHLSYLESINYEYASFVHPLRQDSALGGSVQYLGSGDIAQTDTHGESIGQFSTHFAAYSLAYGQALGDRFSLGAAAKLIDAKIANVGAQAYAADLGSLYKVTNDLRLAAVLTNAGTKLTFLNDGGTLPLAFHLGTSYEPNPHYSLSLEGVYENTGLLSAHAGVEWKPLDLIALRAGYRTDTTKGLSPIAGLTTGLGISAWGQELAYAWVPYGDLGNTQYFSLLVRFGQSAQEKRNLIQYQSIKAHRTAGMGDRNIAPTDPEYQQLMQLLSETDGAMYSQKLTSSGRAR